MQPRNIAIIPAILICFLPAIVKSQSSDLDVSLSSRVDRSQVRVGEEFRFEVTVRWSGSPADYDIGATAPPALVGLKMIGSESKVSAGAGSGAIVRQLTYTLEPTEVGKGKIGAVELTVHDRKADKTASLATDPLEVDILSPPVFALLLSKITSRKAIGGGLILFALGTAAGGVIMMRRKKRTEIAKQPVVEVTPEQAFVEAVREASSLRFAGDLKNSVTKVEGALLDWMQTRFELSPRQWPDGIISQIREKSLISVEYLANLDRFAKKCQAIKFAGEKPSGEEIDNLINCVKTMVCGGTMAPSTGSKIPKS